QIGKQEADCDGLDTLLLQFLDLSSGFLFIERNENIADGRNQAFRHDLAMTSADERANLPGNVLHDRIVLRALMAADMNDVAIAAGGDHSGPGAFVFENSVGADRGSVKQMVELRDLDAFALAELGDSGNHAN